jgi:predicted dehydrogenase
MPNRPLPPLTRRDFVRRSVGAATALTAGPLLVGTRAGAQVAGANDTVGLGVIGAGIRGEILLRTAKNLPGVRVLEVSDVYDGHFERTREIFGDTVRTNRDYRRMLDNPDVHGVVIVTPDHLHRQMTLDAFAAGKDVYIEKPMTYRWDEGPEIIATARDRQRMVVVGSQYESMPANAQAREIITSGRIGKVTLVGGAVHRNTPTGAWYYPVAPDASPETIDWDRFLGPAPKRPFDARRFFQWRLFWDYSGGLPTDLFVHLVTATHVLMDVKMPSRVSAFGGILHWKDREVPDQVTAMAEYDEGFTLSLSATANNNHQMPLLTFYGTEGTLEYHGTRLVLHQEPILENYGYSTAHFPQRVRERFFEQHDVDPQTRRPRATATKKAPPSETIDTPGRDSTELHLAKFVDSIRSRKPPVQDAEMGHLCATVGHMCNISLRQKTIARWDKGAGRVSTT